MRLNIHNITAYRLSSLVGINPTAFVKLTTLVWVKRPDKRRGRPWELSFMNRMFLVTLHLKTNLTERALGELFGVGNAECAECATAQSRVQKTLKPRLEVSRAVLSGMKTIKSFGVKEQQLGMCWLG